MAEKNKVKFGLKNVKIFPFTISGKTVQYEAGFDLPGAVNLTLKAEGESENFYADDVAYYVQSGNSGYSGDFECAILTDEFKTKILGYVEDKKGVLFEKADGETKQFAMAFEFQGDKLATRHILYNCSCGRPDVESETISDKKTPKTDKLSISVAPAIDTNIVKAKCYADSDAYATFYDAPYVMDPKEEM